MDATLTRARGVIRLCVREISFITRCDLGTARD